MSDCPRLARFCRRIRNGALASTCLIALASGAVAQQPASPLSPSPTMPAPGGSSSAAPAPNEPSPAMIALARDVVIGSGISRSFEVIVPQFLDQIGTSLTQTRPDLIRDLNGVMEKIKPEFDKQTQDLITNAAKSYASRLSEKQLRDTADFFKGPSGQAYVASQPQVMGDLFPQMQAFQQRVASDLMTRVRTEMKARGHQL